MVEHNSFLQNQFIEWGLTPFIRICSYYVLSDVKLLTTIIYPLGIHNKLSLHGPIGDSEVPQKWKDASEYKLGLQYHNILVQAIEYV